MSTEKIRITVAQQKLLREVDDCPWCPGHKPEMSTRLVGIRSDPDRIASMTCPNCGVSKSITVSNDECIKAQYSIGTRLLLLLLPRLVKAWNWKNEMSQVVAALTAAGGRK